MDAQKPVTHPPPAGGYGSGPPSRRFGPVPEEDAPPARSARPFLTAAIIVVSLASVLALVVVSCRRYIAVAKTAEVRDTLATIAKDAAAAHEAKHRVCPSASLPVPADLKAVSGNKYTSRVDEWTVDAASDSGFACLGFEMSRMQYYQYRYDATPRSFTASGRGDLNGNGVFSEFTWSGQVEGERLVIARKVTERNTEE